MTRDPLAPFDARPLIRRVDGDLITLLCGLELVQWRAPTVCRDWSVRDIAAHLLDGTLRRLASERDQHRPAPQVPIETYSDLVAFLNSLNAEWVRAARRLSPRLITDLLEASSSWLHQTLDTLDLQGPAVFPVSWAGEASSRVWFDLAREYTEKWHHQQQIREAVGAPTQTSRQYLRPVFDTFMRALPHLYRDFEAASGTSLRAEIEGAAGGNWFLVRESDGWRATDKSARPDTHVSLPQDAAWRLFTKGISPATARPRLRYEGDKRLAERLLDLLAVMA